MTANNMLEQHKLALIRGFPLELSLSPFLYSYWGDLYDVPLSYSILPIRTQKFTSTINRFVKQSLYGFNVTTPYKQDIIPLLDDLSETAQKTGAVNLVYRKNDKLIGDNSDVFGFASMVSHIDFNNKKIAIIGAGGASISALFCLRDYDVTVMNRSKKNILGITTQPIKHLEHYDIVINATTIPIFANLLHNSKIVKIDLNYKFRSEYDGLNILTGEEMLIQQAKKAFFRWFGIMPATAPKLSSTFFSETSFRRGLL